MTWRPSLWRILRRGGGVAVVLLALAHASGYAPLSPVTRLDLAITDARLRLLMPGTRDPRIVIVDVDEKSLPRSAVGHGGRDRLAALVDELVERQRAAAIGFDMVFAEPDPAHDARFAQALAGRPVVLGYYLTSDRSGRRSGVLPQPLFDAAAVAGRGARFTRWDGYAANLAVLAQAAPQAGFFNAKADADGVMRSVPLVAEVDGRHYASLALALLRQYTGNPAASPAFAGSPGAAHSALGGIVLTQGTGRITIPVDDRVRVAVPFRGPGGPGGRVRSSGGSFEYVSAADLLQGRVPAAHLAGKLVLVGTSAPGLYDQASTPVSAVLPGVEVHANLLSGLLDDRLPFQPDWASGFDMLQLALIAVLVALLLPRLGAVTGVAAVTGLAAALIGFNLWAYTQKQWALPLAAALLLTGLLYAGATIWAYIVEGRSRRSLARLFGSYVPPELVDEMARDPARYDMRAENRELTVMFCDMRNFTRISELLAPEDVRGLVNRFFTSMTVAIRHHRGTLDKYIGDAIMAFWGAPLTDAHHAANAVRAALAMVQGLEALNAELRGRGLPEVGVGIGLNTGVVCVGDMGSDIRRSYTVMGDAVNLASRIEALTRHYGVDILVGEATRQAAGETLGWIEVDRVRVKGKQQSVTLFTPLDQAVASDPRMQDELRLWNLALGAYRLQHWDEAQTGLRALRTGFAASAWRGLHDRLDERIRHYRSTPPPTDWDGAHTFDTK